MKLFHEFIRPSSIGEALTILNASSASACLIAGGTDLILDIRQSRRQPPYTLVDVTSIPELSSLEIRGTSLFIGAAVPLSKISENPLIHNNVQALQEACRLIGGPQVRNVATLGGNVAHALPAADGTIAMLCFDTTVAIASIDSIREISLDAMFLGPGKSILQDRKEMIVGFNIPLKQTGQSSAFNRVMNPQGIALPILNLSILMEREGDILSDIHIAAGPSKGIPERLVSLEDYFRGTRINSFELNEQAITIIDQVPFRTSKHRASADYRHQLLKTLFADTFKVAWDRAGLNQEITYG